MTNFLPVTHKKRIELANVNTVHDDAFAKRVILLSCPGTNVD